MLKVFPVAASAVLLSSCGIGGFWMNGDPSAGLNIKPYLQYWEKTGAGEEDRQQDWMACGGMKNGSYANDAPQGSPTAVILEASQRKRAQMDQCMTLKGYRRVGEVEIPMPGGPQGTPDGNAKLIEYVGGVRKGATESRTPQGEAP